MANQPLGFGNKNTADVRLNLINSAGVEYPGDPLLLHSRVLKKAEYFKTKLSQIGFWDKQPFEMKVTCSHHPDCYIKCIQLIHSYDTDECFNFKDVDEALAILPVASEVMFRDCMEPCMQYLDAVRWSRAQEANLRVLLSSLNINVLPDLAARLGILSQRLEFRNTVEKHIFDYFKLSTSPAIKDACRHVILKQLKADVKAIKSKSDEGTMKLACSDLLWLVGVIRNCDAKLSATMVKEFCEDPDLPNAVDGGVVQDYDTKCDMRTILILQILKGMGNGEIIIPMSFRVDFLTNWADTMVKLLKSLPRQWQEPKQKHDTFESALETGIIGVGETLPLVEQKRIYSFWQDIFTKNSMTTSSLFKWWAQKLSDAIILHKNYKKKHEEVASAVK